MVNASQPYRALSQRLLEDDWVADEIIIGKPEVGGAHNRQIDCIMRASLNGDTLAMISFSVFEGKPSSVRVSDWRHEGADPTLLARLMFALQQEFPGQEIPGLHDEIRGYNLLVFKERPDFPAIKKINLARDLKKKVATLRADGTALEAKRDKTEKDMKVLSSIWAKWQIKSDELDYMIHEHEVPDDWETCEMPRIRIITGFKPAR